jgi:predicted nucleic acid-binding Zn ribbon protein
MQTHPDISPTTHPTKACVACGGDIPIGASLCPLCKSYQRVWKNHLQYFAGMAALIVLSLTATSWLFTKAKAGWFYRDNIRVIVCNSLGSAVIVNRGDSEVFVSHLLLTMAGRSSLWVSPRLEFYERLQPGQFLRREFPKARLTGEAQFVRGADPNQFETDIERAVKDDPCFDLVFYEASDDSLRELTQMAGPTLNTFPVGGYGCHLHQSF